MKGRWILAVAMVLGLSAQPAFAYDGVAASSGAGRDEASACHEAKRNANLAVGSALQMQGIAARYLIVGFGSCLCSFDPSVVRNPSWDAFAYNCTVDVQYDLLYDE
jgi:hypothetical protein